MKKFKLFLFVFILSLTACQEQMETPSDATEGGYTFAKDRLWMIKKVGNGMQSKAVAEQSKVWQSGDTIRIKFLNGDATLQGKVKQYAALWLDYADLIFEYVEGDADVKISFDWEGKLISWSTIGKDCQAVPQNESSLNFVYLDDPDEDFVRGEVLRAFGHVLGLGFEHKNPDSPLVFKANAAATLQSYYGLTDAEVLDFMAQYETDQTNYTNYDKTSIMVVEIPGGILENRRQATSFNTALSANDIAFISALYKLVEPQKTLEFEVLADSLYSTLNVFCVDDSKENIYYLRPESFPVNYESGRPRMMKRNLNTGMETQLFDLQGIVGGFVVDKQENFYINLRGNTSMGLWKYNMYGFPLYELRAPAGYPFFAPSNPVVIDNKDYVYSFSSTMDFPMLYPDDVLLDSTRLPERVLIDTTYIYRFVSTASSCIKKFSFERKNLGDFLANIVNGNMFLRCPGSSETEFYQVDIPDGRTLVKKSVNITGGYERFFFLNNRNGDEVYLITMNIENDLVKSSLYRYTLSNGETRFIGDLPSELIKSDGAVLDRLQYCGGEVLNDKELLLFGIVGYGENACVVKVNMIPAN